DLPALKRLLQGLRTRELDLVDVETSSASPYAASLLFDYVANYMYEDDTPPAERRAQALSLDRDLLRELLGQEELRDLLDRDAVEEVERELRRSPRNPDELHDQLRLRGDLRAGEYDEAFARPPLARRAAEGGRGGRAGGIRAVPAALARDRPAGDLAGSARSIAGSGPPGLAVGNGGAAAPRARIPAGAARRALCLGRGRVGRRGARPGGGVLPRRRRRSRSAGRRDAAG